MRQSIHSGHYRCYDIQSVVEHIPSMHYGMPHNDANPSRFQFWTKVQDGVTSWPRGNERTFHALVGVGLLDEMRL